MMTVDGTASLLWLVVVAVVAVGCSSSSSSLPPSSSTSSPEPVSPTSVVESTETSMTAEVEADADEEVGDVAPLRQAGDAAATGVGQGVESAYVSRISMSGSSIELTWSAEGDVAEYRLHRMVRTSDSQPGLEAMTADNEIHAATEPGRFVDDAVTSGERYWFGVRALDADGTLISSGWHAADAVTDIEPPSMVGDLSATADGGEVLVSWSKPDENYELHGYRLLRIVDGGEPEALATTWTVDQTSFIDDQPPPSGVVAYEVVAFDFHWNESAPARVDLRRR